MTIFIEYLCLRNLISILFFLFKKKKITSQQNRYLYFDSSNLAVCFVKFLNIFFSIELKKLNFKLSDIKDENNELVRLRVERKDLFEIQELIMKNNIFIKINPNINDNRYYFDYIKKSLIDGHIVAEPKSINRAIFLINVVHHYISNNHYGAEVIFFIGDRPWKYAINEYSMKFNINLFFIPKILDFKYKKYFYKKYTSKIKYLKYVFPSYIFFNNFFYNILFLSYPFIKKNENKKIYLRSPGYFNIDNNELNSDFFINHNSNLSYKDIIYPTRNNKYLKILKNNKINTGNKINSDFFLYRNDDFKITPKKIKFYKKEYLFCKELTNKFSIEKKFYKKYFLSKNIKIYLSFYKYTKDHIAVSEAIKSAGGISAIWQWAFEGMPFRAADLTSDIYFNFNHNLIFNNISKATFNVSVGYIMDYKFQFFKQKSQELKNLLKKNGAKKIITVLDENSKDDPRWHTGHHLQIENYYYILEEVIKNENLGVIFKPKNPETLSQRISEVNNLLNKAKQTGRCLVLDSFEKNHSNVSPCYPAFASDLVIHSHLCAGSAAVECALAGVPTILLDREGTPFNILNEISKSDLIFQNWTDLIYFLSNSFYKNKQNKSFGIWPLELLDKIDQFRDGKAAFRLGNYLKTMIDCFNKGYNREDVLSFASEQYMQLYGKDKILFLN